MLRTNLLNRSLVCNSSLSADTSTQLACWSICCGDQLSVRRRTDLIKPILFYGLSQRVARFNECVATFIGLRWGIDCRIGPSTSLSRHCWLEISCTPLYIWFRRNFSYSTWHSAIITSRQIYHFHFTNKPIQFITNSLIWILLHHDMARQQRWQMLPQHSDFVTRPQPDLIDGRMTAGSLLWCEWMLRMSFDRRHHIVVVVIVVVCCNITSHYCYYLSARPSNKPFDCSAG